MSYQHPPVEETVRDAKNGERVTLADGSTGTVTDYYLTHLDVDASVYRKVVFIDTENQFMPSTPYLDKFAQNTETVRFYRVNLNFMTCDTWVNNHEQH